MIDDPIDNLCNECEQLAALRTENEKLKADAIKLRRIIETFASGFAETLVKAKSYPPLKKNQWLQKKEKRYDSMGVQINDR